MEADFLSLLNRLAVAMMVAGTLPVMAQFGAGFDMANGPDILGRLGPSTGMKGTAASPINVQAALNAVYDSSLLAYNVADDGVFRPRSSAGVEAAVGIFGRKIFRRSFVGLNYGGNYGRYAGNTVFNGTNHQLSLAMGMQFSRRWQVVSQTGIGTSNRFIGGPSVFQASEFEFLTAPVAELFDARSYFLGNTSSLIYTRSSRQSFRASGTGTTVRRRAVGLADMRGYGASGDWVYRVSRRTSLGVSYTFNHFDFEKIFGDSDVQTIGVHFGRQIGRDWQFTGGLTGSRQSTVGVRSFALDPVVAAILGRGSGSEVFETDNLLYGYNAALTRRLRHANFRGFAQRSINAGNGFFLTSLSESAGISYSQNLSRELVLSGSVDYNKLKSLGFASGRFEGWNLGTGITYKLTESVGLSCRFDFRTFDLERTTFGRTGSRITAGLTYFPTRGNASAF